MQPKSIQVFRSIVIIICGISMSFLFSQIAEQSVSFEQGTNGKERPIIEVIGMFWRTFGIYLFAWALIGGFSNRKNQNCSRFSWVEFGLIFVFAVWFRVVMIPSVPIQEIDLYRYVWDGAVVSNRLDPYQFGPETVENAFSQPELTDSRSGLDDYTAIVASRPGLERVLDIVHYGKYTSPYPPVSQLFFAVSVSFVDDDAPAKSYVVAMKTMLVVFDILTGLVLALLLRHIGMSPSLSLAYLWCPLVVKEISNGGHLDSIATFFMTLAIYLAARAMWPRLTSTLSSSANPKEKMGVKPLGSAINAALSAISLAAAIAAKIFPIVLVPIWFLMLLRKTGVSSGFALLLLATSTCLFLYPMVKHLELAQKTQLVPPSEVKRLEQADPSGIEAFSKLWEMNDFLFMLVVENLKPDRPTDLLEDGSVNHSRVPWFRFTSNKFREQVVETYQPVLVSDEAMAQKGYSKSNIAFFLTRAITMAIFALISVWCCIEILYRPTAQRWLEMAFLTLAWFWLLSPTQNPWYWTWAIPLLPFAVGRAWFFMSGILFSYYLRFWFGYQFDQQDVIAELDIRNGNPAAFDWLFPFSDTFRYQGNTFFDFYIPFLEFGPWFVLLFVAAVIRLLSSKSQTESAASDSE